MGPMFVGVVENKMILFFGEIILFVYFGDYYYGGDFMAVIIMQRKRIHLKELHLHL